MVTFNLVQCHPGLTYSFNFWYLGTLDGNFWTPTHCVKFIWTWTLKCQWKKYIWLSLCMARSGCTQLCYCCYLSDE